VRTTLDIDDDILSAARDRARREGRSVGSVVSELARTTLTSNPYPAGTDDDPLGFTPLPSRGGIVTNELIDELLDDF
jgi:hypothetical protein